ncbi:MmgE/PrpD family protein [Streptomyces sp. NPDC052052]|uniref:MmgE/PrpD family protein n=1 Tax=Streptomyces sp. NPDC052052 TaxID=3154756 RepID=UPI00343F8E25
MTEAARSAGSNAAPAVCATDSGQPSPPSLQEPGQGHTHPHAAPHAHGPHDHRHPHGHGPGHSHAHGPHDATDAPAAVQLACWATELTPSKVPSVIRRVVCRQLLDGLGCALAAARSGQAAPALAVAAALGGPPEAAVPGLAEPLGAPAAALALGALVHALDYDDTHPGALVHATASVLPALFASAAAAGADGPALLTAATAGYETALRIGLAAPYRFHARGLHATQVAAVFAAAVTASVLERRSAEVTAHAVGIAGSSAGGLLEFLDAGSDTKALHPGLAAHAGLLAARLAAAGAEGPATVLEGRNGVYAALADQPVTAEALVGDLGEMWHVSAVESKLHPCCHLLHRTLEAAAVLRGRLVPYGGAQALESVVAEVPPGTEPVVCVPRPHRVAPRTPYEAKFALPFSTALMLCDGTLTLDSYRADALDRPDVTALAARISHTVRPYDGPDAEAPGVLRARLRDGTELDVRVDGGPVRPPDAERVTAKFHANAGGETALTRELAERVLRLDREESIREVLCLASAVLAGHPAP